MDQILKLIIYFYLFNFNRDSLIFSINVESIESKNFLSDTTKHLFYFVQVSDLHLTHFGHADRIKQFEEFCNDIIRTLIKPKVTVVSGDLVNSANDNLFLGHRPLQSAQYEEEWQIYQNILSRTGVTQSTLWLDMRGNHDTFMDSDPDSNQSFYRIYSHQGHQHTGSYQYTIETNDGDSYSFISVDLCPRPGLGRPFNLFGYLSQREKVHVEKLIEQTKNSTATIFFGHYPLNFGYTNELNQLMKNALVYLNGHLHMGRKDFFTVHNDQLLEIHLADWKSKRKFRIITVDGGLISFEDYRYNQSIYAVISNPKPAKFKTHREPLNRLKESSHIRILIFSQEKIVNVEIVIDGKMIGHAKQSVDNQNLFVLPWNTDLYDDEKLHEISVQIQDQLNQSLILKRQFSLSIKTDDSIYLSKVFLSLRWPIYSLIITMIFLLTLLFILILHRYQLKQKSIRFLNRRLLILCSVDVIFYSLIGLIINHLIGPWYFGYLTENYYGVVFLWGSFVKGSFIPPDFQLSLGSIQFFLVLMPLTYSFSSSCFYRYKKLQSNRRVKDRSTFDRFYQIFTVHIIFIFALTNILFSSYGLTISYRISWIVSPFGFLLLIFTFYLYIRCQKLKVKDFQMNNSILNNVTRIKNDQFNIDHQNEEQPISLLFKRESL